MHYSPPSEKESSDYYQRARELVRHLPITVERYDSGRIGFVARPVLNGRRFNRSFSTWAYPSLEAAAQAAKDWCKEKLLSREDSSKILPTFKELEKFAAYALEKGVDPMEAFRVGLAALTEKKSQETLHKAGTVSWVVLAFANSKRAENVTEPYLKELISFYKPLELEFGDLRMADITTLQIEALLEKLTRAGRIRSKGYRKRWLSKFAYLWDFAAAPGRNWARRNIITDLK